MTRSGAGPRGEGTGKRPRSRFADLDFDAADRVDTWAGIGVIDDARRRELMKVVHSLAEADHIVAEVRHAMVGPYGGLLRLTLLNRRIAKAVARATALNDELEARFDQVLRFPGGARAAEVLRDRMRLHLEVDAELVAGLSPERRVVVDSLRASWATSN